MDRMEELIFLHTSTIGIRKYPVSRTVLKQEIHTIQTHLGPADVKYIDRLGTICPHAGIRECKQAVQGEWAWVFSGV